MGGWGESDIFFSRTKLKTGTLETIVERASKVLLSQVNRSYSLSSLDPAPSSQLSWSYINDSQDREDDSEEEEPSETSEAREAR